MVTKFEAGYHRRKSDRAAGCVIRCSISDSDHTAGPTSYSVQLAVSLNTHIHIELRFRMSGATHLFAVFMSNIGYLHFYFYERFVVIVVRIVVLYGKHSAFILSVRSYCNLKRRYDKI
jgi:hypothetical protein